MRAHLAVLMLLGPALASAEPRPDFSVKDTRIIAYDFATCVVKRRAAQAREVILANHGNDIIMKRYPGLANADCLVNATSAKTFNDVEMRFSGDFIRYGLADALFATELAAVPPRDLSGVARLHHMVVDESAYLPEPGKKVGKRRLAELQGQRAIAAGSAALSRFGECVVRRDSRNSHALLAAKPSMPEETRALASLQPAFSTCLSEGQTFKTNRMMMRGTIAINYYRLAFAPAAPAAEIPQ